MGVALLPQLYFIVPMWLFCPVLVGWLAYVAVALAVASRRGTAYPVALVLAILTLLVSLPQPEHYAFLRAGYVLAGMTFLIGSALQLALIILIPIYLIKKRNNS